MNSKAAFSKPFPSQLAVILLASFIIGKQSSAKAKTESDYFATGRTGEPRPSEKT